MKKFERKYTRLPWSGFDIDTLTGNHFIIASSGLRICEMLQPVLIEGQEDEHAQMMIEQDANERLIRNVIAMAEKLEDLHQKLTELKTGEINIFDFDVSTEIALIDMVLTRATQE